MSLEIRSCSLNGEQWYVCSTNDICAFFCASQFSLQVDFIRQQLEFEAQQLRSVMEERFGTSDEMVQRTQVRTDYRLNATFSSTKIQL